MERWPAGANRCAVVGGRRRYERASERASEPRGARQRRANAAVKLLFDLIAMAPILRESRPSLKLATDQAPSWLARGAIPDCRRPI
jgi:hypothetical protein